MEQHYGQFFDHVIVNDGLQVSCVQLMTAVRRAQEEPQWVPASWIRPTEEIWIWTICRALFRVLAVCKIIKTLMRWIRTLLVEQNLWWWSPWGLELGRGDFWAGTLCEWTLHSNMIILFMKLTSENVFYSVWLFYSCQDMNNHHCINLQSLQPNLFIFLKMLLFCFLYFRYIYNCWMFVD